MFCINQPIIESSMLIHARCDKVLRFSLTVACFQCDTGLLLKFYAPKVGPKFTNLPFTPAVVVRQLKMRFSRIINFRRTRLIIIQVFFQPAQRSEMEKCLLFEEVYASGKRKGGKKSEDCALR